MYYPTLFNKLFISFKISSRPQISSLYFNSFGVWTEQTDAICLPLVILFIKYGSCQFHHNWTRLKSNRTKTDNKIRTNGNCSVVNCISRNHYKFDRSFCFPKPGKDLIFCPHPDFLDSNEQVIHVSCCLL